MRNLLKNRQGVVSLIGMLITLVIIAFLMYRVSKIYFNTNTGSEYRKQLAEQGVNQANPVSVINTAEQKVKEANKQTMELQKQAATAE
jgi:hypothetical protein